MVPTFKLWSYELRKFNVPQAVKVERFTSGMDDVQVK